MKRYRIVPDTRVKAFSRKSAEQYLRAHNKLSVYCPLDKDIWEIMRQDPDQDLVQAYEDLAQAEAFGATERFLAFLTY